MEDNIRIRIPRRLKQRFKKSYPHGKMTDLLKAVILTTLEGAKLSRMAKKPPAEATTGVGIRTKYYTEDLQKADSYIRFLVDTETKEKFKLYCYLKGTTMSNFLREAVEDILQEEAAAAPPRVRQFIPAPQPSTIDIREMWSQTFGQLCA